MSTPRVIGYARLSDASREESTSIARQRQIIEQTAAARGYDLVAIEVDDDVSATKARLDRPALSRVRKAIAEGDAEAVLVWRLDRLARSVGDISVLLDEGLVPISATEPIDATSSMGRAMVEVLQVFAGLEARSIRDRVSSSVNHLRRSRRFPGGTVPYGYRTAPNPDGPGRVLEVEPDEARVVREVADRLLGGESLYRIAGDLNARAVPTRRGAQWSITALRQIVLAPASLGRVVVKGDVLRDESGKPETVWQPLLPLADVERLRALLAPRPAGARRTRAARLLSGLVSCASCGSVLRVKANGSGLTVYACQRRSSGHVCAAPVSVSAQRLDEFVEATYLDLFGAFAEVRVEETVADVAALAEVEEALRETALAMTAPDADITALAVRLADLRTERERVAAAPSAVEVKAVETGRRIAEAWADAELDEKRRLLSSALEVVVVRPGRRGARGLDEGRLDVIWRAG